MGMAVDEAIKAIHKMLAYTDLSVRENLNADMIDACHMAIDTMRKYQKIEQIINNAKDSDGAVKYNWLYEQIREVVEDGSD